MHFVLFVVLVIGLWCPKPALAEEPIGLLFDASASTNTVTEDVTGTLDALAGLLSPDITFNVVVWQSEVTAEVRWHGSDRFSDLGISAPAAGTMLQPALAHWYTNAVRASSCPRAIIIVHGVAADVSDAASYISQAIHRGTFLYFLVVPTTDAEPARTYSYAELIDTSGREREIRFADFTLANYIQAVAAAEKHTCNDPGV